MRRILLLGLLLLLPACASAPSPSPEARAAALAFGARFEALHNPAAGNPNTDPVPYRWARNQAWSACSWSTFWSMVTDPRVPSTLDDAAFFDLFSAAVFPCLSAKGWQ